MLNKRTARTDDTKGKQDNVVRYKRDGSVVSLFREDFWVQFQEHFNGLVKKMVDNFIAALRPEIVTYGAGHRKDDKKFITLNNGYNLDSIATQLLEGGTISE